MHKNEKKNADGEEWNEQRMKGGDNEKKNSGEK